MPVMWVSTDTLRGRPYSDTATYSQVNVVTATDDGYTVTRGPSYASNVEAGGYYPAEPYKGADTAESSYGGYHSAGSDTIGEFGRHAGYAAGQSENGRRATFTDIPAGEGEAAEYDEGGD